MGDSCLVVDWSNAQLVQTRASLKALLEKLTRLPDLCLDQGRCEQKEEENGDGQQVGYERHVGPMVGPRLDATEGEPHADHGADLDGRGARVDHEEAAERVPRRADREVKEAPEANQESGQDDRASSPAVDGVLGPSAARLGEDPAADARPQ